jgi:LPS O-antigen subunit length determinant protein (WzzB/FepE family)
MEPAAILTLALIGGFVWGGFLVILRKAIRKEREKGAR